MKIDNGVEIMVFKDLFQGRLFEVFFYVTTRCDIRCLHCYMGDTPGVDLSIGTFRLMAAELQSLGASKLTLLGGEPTLHPEIGSIARIAGDLGYAHVRLDTNGQFAPEMLESSAWQSLSNICFSLDGADEETYAVVRQNGDFRRTTENIRRAASLGFDVRVTMTVNTRNISHIERVAVLVADLGARSLNLHLTSNDGNARCNSWLLVDEEDWIRRVEGLLKETANWPLTVKIPHRFCHLGETPRGRCEAVARSRLSVAPNGQVYACSLLMSREPLAVFDGRQFVLQPGSNNLALTSGNDAVCPVLWSENNVAYQRRKLLPLCISYKAHVGP